jgi:hypothetical protein
MKCKEINELLVAYLDEEVTPEERQQIEAHLTSCQKCREELRLLASTRDSLRQVLHTRAAGVEPSPRVWNLVRQRIESRTSIWEQLNAFMSHPMLRVAIPVIVVLIAVGALWRTGVLPGYQGSAPVTAPSFSAQDSSRMAKIEAGAAPEMSQISPSPGGQPVEVISVSGPLSPFNPGGPTVEITLKNVTVETVVSLSASLELNRPFNFDFDVTPENPVPADASISSTMTLIGGGFSNNTSYPLVISGTQKSGAAFTYTNQVQITAPPNK